MNLSPNKNKMCVYEILWGMNMQILIEHSIEESGEYRKFGCPPEMCCNSPCQIGALTSEKISERMISAGNLLVDTHFILLGHDFIDKLIFTHE